VARLRLIRAVLASQNANKLAELRAGLPGWKVEALAAEEWPEETGGDYVENAWIKAQFGRGLAPRDVWVLGEDSGIECVALDGAPGLHSARWAPHRNQADALLERLEGEGERRARMVTELVALSPAGDELHVRGVLVGTLATERRGTSGFGYDPIFIPAGHDRTIAQLGEEWKHAHSHRARAAHALLAAVRNGDAS
jgi:XTP/dITP diphosphohydrolase